MPLKYQSMETGRVESRECAQGGTFGVRSGHLDAVRRRNARPKVKGELLEVGVVDERYKHCNVNSQIYRGSALINRTKSLSVRNATSDKISCSTDVKVFDMRENG